jgi:hypothetical protein
MSKPVKIVTLTPDDRDTLRKLTSAFHSAEMALVHFKQGLKRSYAPPTSAYGPFYEIEMEILDDKGDDTKISDQGVTHIFFTQRLK